MISLLSPAKTMDFENAVTKFETSQPEFVTEAEYLVDKLKKLSARQIGSLMKINAELSDLNHQRYEDWNVNHGKSNSRAAMFTFSGEVYRGLQAESFSNNEVEFANDHLAILSGLYGLLRPLDGIKPYRLEMGSKFKVTSKQNNLYKYWGNKISVALNEILADHKEKVVINLASNEYVKVIDKKSLNYKIVDCQFMDAKNGEYKVVMTWAKKARGMMAREIVKHKVDNLEGLKSLSFDNYVYNPKLSSETSLTFTRG